MRIRDYRPEDLPALRAIFKKQAFEYQLPPAETFAHLRVLIDDKDKVQMVIGTRTISEAIMLVNPEWETPRIRFEALRLMHADMRGRLKSQGIPQACCWLPPQIAKSFGSRLMRSFSWVKPLWENFALEI